MSKELLKNHMHYVCEYLKNNTNLKLPLNDILIDHKLLAVLPSISGADIDFSLTIETTANKLLKEYQTQPSIMLNYLHYNLKGNLISLSNAI